MGSCVNFCRVEQNLKLAMMCGGVVEYITIIGLAHATRDKRR